MKETSRNYKTKHKASEVGKGSATESNCVMGMGKGSQSVGGQGRGIQRDGVMAKGKGPCGMGKAS